MSNASPDTEKLTCGGKVTYTCNKGFKLIGNNECKADGKLNGELPICNSTGIFCQTFSFKCLSPQDVQKQCVREINSRSECDNVVEKR